MGISVFAEVIDMLRKSVSKRKTDPPMKDTKVIECPMCWHPAHVPGKCTKYDSFTGDCFCSNACVER